MFYRSRSKYFLPTGANKSNEIRNDVHVRIVNGHGQLEVPRNSRSFVIDFMEVFFLHRDKERGGKGRETRLFRGVISPSFLLRAATSVNVIPNRLV